MSPPGKSRPGIVGRIMKVALLSFFTLGRVAMAGLYVVICVCLLMDRALSLEGTKTVNLEVKSGGTLEIRKSQFQLMKNEGEACKVQVVDSEPMYQQVGDFTPKVNPERYS